MEAYLRKRALVRNQDLNPGGVWFGAVRLEFLVCRFECPPLADNELCRVAFVLCQTFKRGKNPQPIHNPFIKRVKNFKLKHDPCNPFTKHIELGHKQVTCLVTCLKTCLTS
ncbi:hypothetical protein PRUPE_8G057900 [Prunus persica]|uniref:Uncharacterized protein n=1 Tax=Prunus persica TaxID=3760 RepID=M5X977_PRUPE|nr:hypothetical protein PRUPE_8G057900 [Prunus persica]